VKLKENVVKKDREREKEDRATSWYYATRVVVKWTKGGRVDKSAECQVGLS